MLLLPGGVPDAQWAAAVQVVSGIAGQHGFGAPQTVVDRPGQHDTVWPGARESRIELGSIKNATLARVRLPPPRRSWRRPLTVRLLLGDQEPAPPADL